MNADSPEPRKVYPRSGNPVSGRISVRVPWDLLSRVNARAIARGMEKSEAIREALESWVASDTPRPPKPFDVIEAVAKAKRVPRAVARLYIDKGQVFIDGKRARVYQMPPGRYLIEVDTTR